MDSDEDLLSFSDVERPSSPPPERKLKRLKKATAEPSKQTFSDPPIDDSPSTSGLDPFECETPDAGDKDGEDFEVSNWRSESLLEGFGDGNELDTGFDGPEVDKGGRFGAKRALEFDSVGEELDGAAGNGVENGIEDLTTEKPEKKRRDSDGLGEKEKKKKKRGDGHDKITDLAPSNKRREKKERRERLKELRTESQRLLRETRDASFKAVPLVQKLVSSVLEKIRQRKLEVSRKSIIMNSSSLDSTDVYAREVNLDFDFENSPMDDVEQDLVIEPKGDEMRSHPADMKTSLDVQNTERSTKIATHDGEEVNCKMALDATREQRFRPPVDDTQELIFDSQGSDSKDEIPDESSDSPEEVLAPSLLAMNLKLDSALLDDFSDDEEDNDKENVDPLAQGSTDPTQSPNGDPVKAFVDEEAEEEDDSDNDLLRFQEDEEDEDNLDSDEFNDMIATECTEKPVDNEMRNQLHQKWLEQQDATGTEKLLQRLNCGTGLREILLVDEKESDEGDKVEEDEDDEFLDEDTDQLPKNVVRMNLKKAKEMIPLMFSDNDDVYVSSDDEDTEKRHVTRHLSWKAEQATFLSPAEDEGSKEIFGLIKKLNGVPDNKRRAKITSSLNMLSIGGERNRSSKSSFLGRGSKNSLPSFQKQGSGTARAFIFERDDSSSRNALSLSENFADVTQKESRPKKVALAKFSASQTGSSSQNKQTSEVTKSGPSLHEILRCSSLQSSRRNGDTMVSKVEAIYASFRLDQNTAKRDRNVSIRI